MLTEWIAKRLGLPDLAARVAEVEASLAFRRAEIAALETDMRVAVASIAAVSDKVATGDAATREVVAADVKKARESLKEINLRVLDIEAKRSQLAEDLIRSLKMSGSG